MDYYESVDWLKGEVARLRALLEASQREVHGFIQEKAEMYSDPVIGPILKLHTEVEGRKLHEADLLSALSETKEELGIVKRTYGALLDELESKVAL